MDHVHAGSSSDQQVKQYETAAADMVATMDAGGGGGLGSSSGRSAVASSPSSSRDEPDAEEHSGGSSSGSDEEEEEQHAPLPLLADLGQYHVSPLSTDDTLALAFSLLAHPHWGHRLREKMSRYRGHFSRQRVVEVESEARTACPHLAAACARALALALIPLGGPTPVLAETKSRGPSSPFLLLSPSPPPSEPPPTPGGNAHHPSYLTVACEADDDDAGEQAVAAFYAALAHPACTVQALGVQGTAFGTRAAAAGLGRCLSSATGTRRIWRLTVRDVDGFCGAAAWTAFADALTAPNSTVTALELLGSTYEHENVRHLAATVAGPSGHKLTGLRELCVGRFISRTPGPAPAAGAVQHAAYATLEDMERWGALLTRNSTIARLGLYFGMPRGGLLGPVFQALVTNTTLQALLIGPGNDLWNRQVAIANDEDTLALAAMLRANKSLKSLHIRDSGIRCDATLFHQGLAHNTTLEALAIRMDAPFMDAAFVQALIAALAADGGTTTSNAGPRLKYLILESSGTDPRRSPTAVPPQTCFPSAVALGNMLASNRTLTELTLDEAPYSNQEWATTIFPAIAGNHTLEKLFVNNCSGVAGGLVYDAVLELLDVNTHIRLDLNHTPLYDDLCMVMERLQH